MGIRKEHFDLFCEAKPNSIDWGEALTENYIRWESGFLPHSVLVLESIRKNMPVALHGVSLSIGSSDPVNFSYLKRLKELVDRIEPIVVSDHLCWTGVQKKNSHDLLPLPYHRAAIDWIVSKVQKVQDYLKRPILLENVSSYIEVPQSNMTEWDFLEEISRRSGCGILFDINNVFVSSYNHGFDPLKYFNAIPAQKVGQIHLAGHRRKPDVIVDTHDNFICPEVWQLYELWVRTQGKHSVMIEWDSNVPDWSTLEHEIEKVRRIYEGKSARSTAGLAAPLF